MNRAFALIVLVSAVTIPTSAQDANGKMDPSTALWLAIKKQLTGADALAHYERSIKGALLPLVGKLVSATSTERPTTLTFLMPEGEAPELTLHIKGWGGREASFPGPLTVGSTFSFEGVVVSFKEDPFMLVMDFQRGRRDDYRCDELSLHGNNVRPLACNFRDSDPK
jgi:hypothetical protein